MSWFRSSHIHAVLDVREEGVSVEFVVKEKNGALRSVAKTYLVGSSSRVAFAVLIVSACKEMLEQYPQFKPQSVLVLLHAPFTTRTSDVVTKQFTVEQTITAATVKSLVDEASPIHDSGVLVHSYVPIYRLNGYRIYYPVGKRATEVSLHVVRTYITDDVYRTMLAPLQTVFGAPLRAANFVEGLTMMLTEDSSTPLAYAICDVAQTYTEVARVEDGEYATSVRAPVGIASLMQTVADTSGLSLEEVSRSLPLHALGTLEEKQSTRLAQGIAKAAEQLRVAVLAAQDSAAVVPVPYMFVFPTESNALLDACIQTYTGDFFASSLPSGDTAHIAHVLGL
jgi:hypothetical protein